MQSSLMQMPEQEAHTGLGSRLKTPGAGNRRGRTRRVVWKEEVQALDGPPLGPIALPHDKEHIQRRAKAQSSQPGSSLVQN